MGNQSESEFPLTRAEYQRRIRGGSNQGNGNGPQPVSYTHLWLTMASGEGVTCSRLARSALALARPWRADLNCVAVGNSGEHVSTM